METGAPPSGGKTKCHSGQNEGVIPMTMGIQSQTYSIKPWIPAVAGMTHPKFKRNDTF